ncbi:MAG: transglycosylase domain-containing protein [Crocinitomicaceae bacterium]|nr:transglycosylase domain-containing protein [Crocinitomicaceae bacterium]
MSAKLDNENFSDKAKKRLYTLLWIGALSPIVIITALLLFQSEDDLPSIEMLDNPPELLASIIYADDASTELGRFWQVNRTNVAFKDISPNVINALISTEDERFKEHSGVDFRGLSRAVINLGRKGGASTITQQLAKLLFTLQKRENERQARLAGEVVPRTGKLGRINEKAQENIIAVRLEKRFTKEEIITMYLNQFDFLYNAVGIENAAKVYFNKRPNELSKSEAACLIGMVKNPSLYNPRTYQIRDYKGKIAARKGIDRDKVDESEVKAERQKDSLMIHQRRNQVLMQWLKNSEKNNEAISEKLTKEEYDVLKNEPIIVDYQVVDHKEGIAPYFRESLRKELSDLFNSKDENGELLYKKSDGSAYDIYKDGLRIYTTINYNLQQYAEEAVERHLKSELQPEFDRNNKRRKRFPFAETYNGQPITDQTVENIMNRARKGSDRYLSMKDQGFSEKEIMESFDKKTDMTVFSWKGAIDTVMTPNDSIRYYKGFLHAGLISIEPQSGFIKAWVGGADMASFAYDHVKQGKRQVGSTIKPFVYGTALAMGVVKPCTVFKDMPYCVDLEDGNGRITGKWCPSGDVPVGKTVSWALQQSNNPGTVAVMSMMGGYAGPMTISKLLKDLDIHLRPEDEVPAMCLGVMDLSLIEMTGAQAMWANNGIYNRPVSVLRIEDRNGNVIYSADGYSKEVMNENVAYETLKMMKGVVNGGTAGSLRGTWRPWGGLTAPMAGKTGTTQGNADGWYMGLTPDLVTGIWVGAEDKQVRFQSMDWGQGARMALPIFGYYMQKVYKDKAINLTQSDFPVPEGYDPMMFSCDNNPVEQGGDGLDIFR